MNANVKKNKCNEDENECSEKIVDVLFFYIIKFY